MKLEDKVKYGVLSTTTTIIKEVTLKINNNDK